MKKNKGFTLIELMAVLVIIALIAILVTPITSKIINSNRNKIYDDQVKSIISSAKIWGAEHPGRLPDKGDIDVIITIGELREGGYVAKDLENPLTNEPFDDDCQVVISNRNGNLLYEFFIE